MQWRPIKTAPTGNSIDPDEPWKGREINPEIVAYSRDVKRQFIVCALWANHEDPWSPPNAEPSWSANVKSRDGRGYIIIDDVTHWHPLLPNPENDN